MWFQNQNSHDGGAEFPVSKNEVFVAVKQAVKNLNGFSLDSSDEFMGRIVAKAGISMFSWGENVPIQISSIDENNTRVSISSSAKVGAIGNNFNFNKHGKNIEKILNETSRILQSKNN